MLNARTVMLVAAFLLATCNFPEPLLYAKEGSCRGNADCAEKVKGVCDLTPASGEPVCVQCTPGPGGDASACIGVTPACGDDRTCRKCQSHTECASDACLPTGACAAEAEVIYLKEGGTGIACAKGTPCGAWTSAMATLTPARKIIRVTGNITTTSDVNGRTFVILGDASTMFRPGPLLNVFNIVGSGSNVEIYDSKLHSPERNGVNVDSESSVVKLVRCKITGASEEGVRIRRGKVEILESEISGGARRGVMVDATADVRIARSLIAWNAQGGIVVAATGKLILTSSFIVKNQGAEGAIRIPSPGPGSDISFNTIVDNVDAQNGTADTGGIFCDDSSFTFRNNIIYRNRGGVGDQQTFGTCKFDGSYIQVAAANDTRLSFKDANDYHLTAASPTAVKDVTTPGVTCLGLVDYDGESRPQGTSCDLGADELKQ